MKRKFNWIKLIGLLFILLLSSLKVFSTASVVQLSSSTFCVGGYVSLPSLIILEGNRRDFFNNNSQPVGTANGTFTITRPNANFEFNTAANITVGIENFRSISFVSVSITTSTVTITFQNNGNTTSAGATEEEFIVSGIEIRATAASTGNLTLGGTMGWQTAQPNAGVLGTVTSIAVTGTTKTTNGAGTNWGTGANWVGGVAPANGDNVVIAHNMTVNVTTGTKLNNLTINTGRTLTATNDVTVSNTLTLSGTANYVHNNTTDPSGNIFAGATETVSTTSTITVSNWSATNGYAGLARSISTTTIGNLTINGAGISVTFDELRRSTTYTMGDVSISSTSSLIIQSGNDRNLTLTTGSFSDNSSSTGVSAIMLDSYGALTWTVNGNATFNHDFSVVQYLYKAPTINSNVVWNVTGNANFGGCSANPTYDRFDGLLGLGNSSTFKLNVTGDINIANVAGEEPDYVVFMDNSGTGDLTVNCANLTISSGTSNSFQSGSGKTNFFVSTATTISATSFTVLTNLGTSTSKTWFKTGSYTQSGTSTSYFYVSYTQGASTFNCSSNFSQTGGRFNGYYYSTGTGIDSIIIGGNFTFNTSSASCYFAGNYGDGTTVIDISGNATITTTPAAAPGGVYGIYNGDGQLVFNVDGVLRQDDGIFCGSYYPAAVANKGTATFNLGSFDYNGGICYFYNSYITNGATVTFNCVGNWDMDFTNVGTAVVGYNLLTGNALLDYNIGGNFISSGGYTGDGTDRYFFSGGASGSETVDITGNVIISGGDVGFCGDRWYGQAHSITVNISGNVSVSGGAIVFSGQNGTADVNVTGNVSLTGGTTHLKYLDGVATLDVTGSFTLGDGDFNVHGSATDATADNCTVSVFDDFTINGNGIFNFDAEQTSTATNKLYLYGDNITLSGTGTTNAEGDFMRNDLGTGTGDPGLATYTVFGEIYYARTGTITYNRGTTNTMMYQVKQIINSGCIVNASASTNPFIIASHADAENTVGTTNTMHLLDISGTLVLGPTIIQSRSFSTTLATLFTSIYLRSGAEIRTSNVNGLYNGASTASIDNISYQVDGTAGTTNAVNWYLDANSTITYNGTASQVVTGKFPTNFTGTASSDVASGSSVWYKYGILKINNSVSPAAGRCYLAASNVFVRTTLTLTLGELSLGDATATNPGAGYTLTVENAATAAISYVSGSSYLRSELLAANNTAKLQWNIGATTGAHVVPFGIYSGGSIRDIAVSYNNTGATGNMTFSTRATAANTNLPRPTTSNVAACWMMHGSTGGDSVETVIDRFWDFTTSLGTSISPATATVGFKYYGSENTMTAGTNVLGIQHWTGTTWNDGKGGAAETFTTTGTNGVTAGVGSVSAAGLYQFSPYILIDAAKPLPVKLISLEGDCEGDKNVIKWVTASEINNDFFVVQKSSDGTLFSDVKSVRGNGNSNKRREYFISDENSLSGLTYYRIKQVDFDGKTNYSEIISIQGCNSKANTTLAVYPNPGKDKLTVYLENRSNEVGYIVITDVQGREVYNNEISGDVNKLTLNINELSSGIYTVKYSDSQTQKVERLIIKNE